MKKILTSLLVASSLAFALAAPAARAQEPASAGERTFTFTFTKTDVDVIDAALKAMAYQYAAPLYAKLQKQIDEQNAKLVADAQKKAEDADCAAVDDNRRPCKTDKAKGSGPVGPDPKK